MKIFSSRKPAEAPGASAPDFANRDRWSKALSFSLAFHVVIVVFLAWPSKPVFVKPNLLARGLGGSAALMATPLYLPRDGRMQAESKTAKLHLRAVSPAKKNKVSERRHNVVEEDKPKDQIEIGSKEGSALDGPTSGDEVKPALPLDFAEPTIHRSELPAGLQGDVIVEITIDAQGQVTEELLLQGLGHGIDEKVIAAVHDWHFRPATRNGIAIPSKHDVHFHFPS